ncbi:hypothetical protein Pla163_00520 [Planctomycetes bacterium Pla163]|uniref:Uncharacterized protein n=1 Tax=Rohdeia mirabilis TaxID=2528008 RepID=A0A518CUQ5_9BACT|nr:hypothetical protein Pla163_00520 [Planctomycetes bacterium Pla163]
MFVLVPALLCVQLAPSAQPTGPSSIAPASRSARSTVLDDDGGWSWSRRSNCLIVENRLVVGTVSAGVHDPTRKGDVNLLVFDLSSRETRLVELHDRLECDDHVAPSLAVFQDARLFAVYSKDGADNLIRSRWSADPRLAEWHIERSVRIATDDFDVADPHAFVLADGSVFTAFIGPGGVPHATIATGPEQASSEPFALLSGAGRVRVCFAPDRLGDIHLLCTGRRSSEFNGGVRHGVFRDGRVRAFGDSTRAAIGAPAPDIATLTRVFEARSDTAARAGDLRTDAYGALVGVYSVQVDGVGDGLEQRAGSSRHEYRYACWNGTRWVDHRIGHAGSRLHAGADDPPGQVTIDPSDSATLVLSTDAHPATGAPLISAADGLRHHELFRARTPNGGATWAFEALTVDSTADNVRPRLAWSPARGTWLVWLRGEYRSARDFEQQVVALGLDDGVVLTVDADAFADLEFALLFPKSAYLPFSSASDDEDHTRAVIGRSLDAGRGRADPTWTIYRQLPGDYTLELWAKADLVRGVPTRVVEVTLPHAGPLVVE